MPRDDDRQGHDPDAFGAAYRAMSTADGRRLTLAARALSRATGLSGDDVLQMAAERVLAGDRHWPVGVEFIPFLVGVMRSVASNARLRVASSPVRSALSLEEFEGKGGPLPSDQPSPLRTTIGAEDLRRISDYLFAQCEDDEAAGLIVLGLLDGLDGEPLREATGLDRPAYNTKRRWVRRKIGAWLARERNDE